MALTLFIRPQEDLAAPVEWLLTGIGPTVPSGGRSALAAIDTSEKFTDVVVLVPGVCVSLFETDVPTRNRAQLLRAVPFALEEEIAGDVEGLHFAVKPGAAGKTMVMAIGRSWLEQLLHQLRDVGIEPQVVVPDTLCVPPAEQGMTLLLEDDIALVRTGEWAAFTLEACCLDDGLKSLSADGEEHWQIYDARSDHSDQLPVSSGVIATHERLSSALPLLAEQYFQQRPPSLLQGEYAVQTAWSDAWARWRLVAGLLISIGAAYMGGLALENHQLVQQQSVLKTEMTQVFKTAFPEASKIIDPSVQMRNRLSELRRKSGGGSSGFLDLIGGAGKLIIADDKVEVRLLRFRNGRLEMDLQADSIERLEAVQVRLKEADFGADLKSVRNDGGRFQARVILSREVQS